MWDPAELRLPESQSSFEREGATCSNKNMRHGGGQTHRGGMEGVNSCPSIHNLGDTWD